MESPEFKIQDSLFALCIWRFTVEELHQVVSLYASGHLSEPANAAGVKNIAFGRNRRPAKALEN
jgi:hypothetical protein